MRLSLPIAAFVVGCGLSNGVQAQSMADACRAIASIQTLDAHGTQNASVAIRQARNLICRSEFGNWNNSQAASMNLGINIPDTLDMTLGGNTNESNYGTRRSEFCALSSESLEQRASAQTQMININRGVPEAVERCISSLRGIFTFLRLGTTLTQFNIEVRHINPGADQSIRIDGIAAGGAVITATNSPVTCAGITQFPVIFQGTAVLSCVNNTRNAVLLGISLPADQISFEIPGIDNTLQDMLRRLERLEAAFPTGTIAYFLTRSTCPPGWARDEMLIGRYLVGADQARRLGLTVGRALTDGENRATGAHTHGFSAVLTHTFDRGNNRGGTGGHADLGPSTTTPPVGAENQVDGTNAPYVQTLVCRRI